MRQSVNRAVRIAQSQPAVRLPEWFESRRLLRQQAVDTRKEEQESSALQELQDLQIPTRDEIATFPLPLEDAVLKLMMGQRPECSPVSAIDMQVAPMLSVPSPRRRSVAEDVEGVVQAAGSALQHRPLKLFPPGLLSQQDHRHPPGDAPSAPLDLRGHNSVLSQVDPRESAALDLAFGVHPWPRDGPSAGRSRLARGGAGGKRLAGSAAPLHEQYAQSMHRQSVALRRVVAANKATLLQEMEDVCQIGWRPR